MPLELRTCYGLIFGRTRTFEKSTSVSGTYPLSPIPFPSTFISHYLAPLYVTISSPFLSLRLSLQLRRIFKTQLITPSEFDDRLQRTPKSKNVSTATGRVWKSEAFILTRINQNPQI